MNTPINIVWNHTGLGSIDSAFEPNAASELPPVELVALPVGVRLSELLAVAEGAVLLEVGVGVGLGEGTTCATGVAPAVTVTTTFEG